jgi:Protein of unknown function (DUF3499)
VAHQCERPTCAEPAAVAYGFDAARGVAWLETFVATEPHHGRLCLRHAEAMVVPKGWWLEDRRTADHLFASPTADDAQGRRVRRPWRPPRASGRVIDLPLPAPEPTERAAAERSDLPPPLVALPAWTPTFVADDDLDGVLNATSPLLGRAFDRVKASGTRARRPDA